MTDTSKSAILGIGIAIAVGLFGMILKPFSLLAHGILTGPGLLLTGLLGRHLNLGCTLWFIGIIGQFLIIYAIALIAYRRPPFWPLRIGLLVLLWMGCGYLGWLMVG